MQRSAEPPAAVTDKYKDSVKDLYGVLRETRDFEIKLFWERSNYFLLLNTGIAFGFANLDTARYAIAFASMGLITSLLWFWVCLGSKYWQTRWEQRLMDFESHHLPGLAFFSASRDRIHADVARGLGFHPPGIFKRFVYWLALRGRPSVSFAMTVLAALFVVAWAVFFLFALAGKQP